MCLSSDLKAVNNQHDGFYHFQQILDSTLGVVGANDAKMRGTWNVVICALIPLVLGTYEFHCIQISCFSFCTVSILMLTFSLTDMEYLLVSFCLIVIIQNRSRTNYHTVTTKALINDDLVCVCALKKITDNEARHFHF